MAGRVQAGSGARDPKRPPIRHLPGPKNTQTQGNAPVGNNGGRHQGNNPIPGYRIKNKKMAGLVNALVQSQIRAGVDDARKERRMIRREADSSRRKAIKNNRRALGDLNYIFGETGDYMKAMGQQIDQQYGQSQAALQASQAALTQQLQANSQGVAGAVGGDLAALGISNMSDMGFQNDALLAQNLATQQGANQQANLSAQQQGAAAISALLQGMNAGSKMSQYGIQNNALNDELYEIAQGKRDGYNQVREAISDLRGKRGDLTLQQLQALAGSQWAKYLAPAKGHRRRSHGRSQSFSSGGGTFPGPRGGGNLGSSGSSGSSGGGQDALAQMLLGALNGRRR